MDFKDKNVLLTGADGFIGWGLYNALKKAGANVFVTVGDIRNPETFRKAWRNDRNGEEYIPVSYRFDYLFHFASPSSQVLFKRNPAYCIETTVKGLINAADTCRKHGIRLIYPSTGLLSQDRYNEYAMCKKLGEDYVKGLNINALGVRIFASYGPGEDHKVDYASVPFLLARDMISGKKPIVYGDGMQVRDFIYIDDVVNAILHLAEEYFQPIVDVGSGEKTSFKYIVGCINRALFGDNKSKWISPEYVERPKNYVEETGADINPMSTIYKPIITFDEGIVKLVDHLKGESNER